jgi:hypothetical protein
LTCPKNRDRSTGVLRFGFETGEAETIAMCREGRWNDLAAAWQEVRKSKARGTTDANDIRTYWTDPGDILWVTFIGEDLCWGFLEPGEPVPHTTADDEESSFRRIKDGWRSTDKDGDRLGKSNLPGFITKVAAYRGTSCGVERHERLVARINGIRTPDVERVVNAKAELQAGVATLIKHLGPQDFEILVDMMFARAGWRRMGHVGSTTRDKDLDLEMPLTAEKAFVQVKTGATPADLQHYVARFRDMQAYRRLFFVYHSSDVKMPATDDSRVSVLDASAVAGHVIEAGLVDWLVYRVY